MRRGNFDSKSMVEKKVLEEKPHVPGNINGRQLVENAVSPSGIIGFLKIKRDSYGGFSSCNSSSNICV